jgi:hypothetical protein
MSGVFKYGGYLLCGTSWSISSNSGLYEVCVFITSEGEVAIYDGLNPADTAWTLQGAVQDIEAARPAVHPESRRRYRHHDGRRHCPDVVGDVARSDRACRTWR